MRAKWRMTIWAAGVLLAGWVATGVHAQDSGGMRLGLDYATFNAPKGQKYLEIYYGIAEGALKYTKDDAGNLAAQVLLQIDILKDKQPWESKAWKIQAVHQDSTKETRDKMVDQLRYAVQAGDYRVMLKATDLNDPMRVDSAEVEVTIKKASDGKLDLSDVQLAISIVKAPQGQKDVFCKNTLCVIPNPDSFYGSDRPLLYYYVEAYNLNKKLGKGTYKTKCSIADANGKEVSLVKPRLRKKKVVASSVEVGNVNISVLPSGTYFFMFSILDDKEKEIDTASKKFFVYNPQVDKKIAKTAMELDPLYQYFLSLDDAQLQMEYENAMYIVRQDDKRMWNSLSSVDARRNFLAAFWKARDPDPKTPENEMRDEYFKRIEEANKKYASNTREGWRTDRGRVYILYGPPTYVDQFPSTSDSKPYEIWQYDHIPGQGKGEFVFADLTGLREYILVHATPTGEVQNINWRRDLSLLR